ncbi:MAG: HAMP domain-containing histidine kinase [Erysipelotrichaceae bacterium]|nr:HAMP domain-containing histidine kinase [Erysipelotrichaceae bacterium]
MKRLRLWIRELSLMQQFFAIGSLVLLGFLAMILSFVDRNINKFADGQMHEYLERSSVNYEKAYDAKIRYEDENIFTIIYDYASDKVVSFGPVTNEEIEAMDFNSEDDKTIGHINHDGQDTIYLLRKIEGDRAIISIVDPKYYNSLKDSLISGILTYNAVILFILYMFWLWVVSIIKPLNKIIDYLRSNDKKASKEKIISDRRDEIGQLANAIMRMQEEIDNQNLTKQSMIQNISHDLKTPIATIKSYGEAIKDGIYPYDTLEKSVDVIINNADRMESKIYSLITLNKVGYIQEAGEIPDDDINMLSLINEVILNIKVIRPEILIETDMDEVYFNGDKEMWRVSVENIIENALRYADTLIKITLKENYLEIYNDGPFMEADRIANLFKPYAKGTGGKFGLGLSIAYNVCTTFDYTITGENVLDGVSFKIVKDKKKQKENKKTKNERNNHQ